MPVIITKKPKALPPNPFPHIPDPFGYGQRAVNFLRSLKHPKSRLPGKVFALDPWQEEIVRRIYGPCDEHGNRIVRHAIMLLPRGNRKTSLGAALALLHTMGPEAMPSGEVLTAAADQKQARIAYAEAEGILHAADAKLWRKGQANRGTDPKEVIRLQAYRNRIAFPNGSILEALSSDAGTQHGRTPVFCLADELHAWRKRDLWDVLRTGLVKVQGSLLVTITTAGRGQDNIAHAVIDYARKVARGDIDDPATLPILFETDPEADWQDEAVWRAVNPGLVHGYPDLTGLRQLAREAAERPSDRDAFRQLHLNIWLDRSTSPFVDMVTYDRGATPIDLASLKGKACWIGVDLGMTDDLSAVVCAFHDPDRPEGYIVLPFFFMPEDNVEKRTVQSGFPYASHVGEGLILTTPGNVTDYRVIEDTIRGLCETYQVREIAFDPHYAGMLMTALLEDGYPAVSFRQGWVTMGPAIKELERAILAGKFRHGGHPVLRWNFANIAIQDDGKGNKSFNKSKSTEKIDGAVASAMAIARAAQGDDTRSVYETEERPEGFLIW
jgi:phage terminase large subunit-like protein